MDFKYVDTLIDASLENMEKDLAALIRYPSVQAEPSAPNAPFGAAVRGALEEAMKITERMGLSAVDMDGYCCYADAKGTTDEMVGVLGHLDIVPADAKDWKYDPFTMTKEDGKLYGRGTMDDKGPMLAALYGMKALQDAGFKPEKTVRFIFGCNEETGMLCMDHYIENAPCPQGGFTPDGEWPLIVGEKGILHYQLNADWSFAIGYGFDNPNDADARYAEGRLYNDRAYIDAFYQVTDNFKLGLEYGRLSTDWDKEGTGYSDRIQFSAFYDF